MGHGYRVRTVTFAEQQYASLSREGKAAVNPALVDLRRDPEIGSFDRKSHTWSYGTLDVVLLYTIEHNLVTVTVLRILSGK